MAGPLAAIGFEFTDPDEFQARMLALAATTVERLDCEAGDYAIWRSRTGAEIWFHLTLFGAEDDARDIVGLTPFFEGGSEIALRVTRHIGRAGDNAFEGAFEACFKSGEIDAALVFDAVDFAAHAGRQPPYDCHARLLGFAHRVAVSSAAEGFDKSETTAGTARLTGRILELRRLTNEITGGPFTAIVLSCAGHDFDIVAAPASFDREFAVGETVGATCALFGRLLD